MFSPSGFLISLFRIKLYGMRANAVLDMAPVSTFPRLVLLSFSNVTCFGVVLVVSFRFVIAFSPILLPILELETL